MERTHLYTTHESDEFLLNAFDMFRNLEVFNPQDHSTGYNISKYYADPDLPDGAEPVLGDLTDRVISSEELENIEIGKQRSFSKNERLETRIVIVNAPIDFQEISEMYPKAIVAGYATNDQEAADIQAAAGIDNPFIFRYGKENQPDKFLKSVVNWRFAVSDLRNSGLGGILTNDNYKGILAQGVRKKIFTPFDMCGSCSYMFDYRKVQNHFLRMDNEGIKELFRYSQIFNEKYKDYPILKTIKKCKSSENCQSGPHARALTRFRWDYNHWKTLQKIPRPLRWALKNIPFEWILK